MQPFTAIKPSNIQYLTKWPSGTSAHGSTYDGEAKMGKIEQEMENITTFTQF